MSQIFEDVCLISATSERDNDHDFVPLEDTPSAAHAVMLLRLSALADLPADLMASASNAEP